MKNKVFRILLIVVTITLSVFCLNKAISVKADSGWDTDYDSGSSWDSDSDWDSGSSWDSDSGSSGGSSSSCTTEECKKNQRIFAIVGLISFGVIFVCAILYNFIKATLKEKINMIRGIIAFIVVIGGMFAGIILTIQNGPISLLLIPLTVILGAIINPNRRTTSRYTPISSNHDISNYEEMKTEEVNKVIPNFNIEEFNTKAYQIFYDTQMAWMEFEYDKLKEILSDELYNTYEMDLEALKVKNQKNIMKDFKLKQIKLFELRDVNGIYTAKVVLEVEFIDFIEDSIKHKVLRGDKRRKITNTYILTFERSKKIKEDNICPKCGAPVEGNTAGICEYCKSKIINDNYDWIMSKKEKINQK